MWGKFLITTSIIFVSFTSFSQQNLYSGGANGTVLYLKPMSNSVSPNLRRGSYVGMHILGDTISAQLNIFEKKYVYFKMSSGAYPVDERVVLKRNLYKKIKEFEEFIVKSYSSKLISRYTAQIRLDQVLSIGIRLLNYDTRQVEREVKKIKTPTEFEKYILNLKFE